MLSKTKKEKIEIAQKKLETRFNIAKELSDRWYTSDKSSKDLYYKTVRYMTEISYWNNLKTIDPNRIRGKKKKESGSYSLDHNYSIMMGFIEDIDPYIISHPCNLQIICSNENLSKSCDSWITLEELKNNISKFDENDCKSWFNEYNEKMINR